MKKPGTTNPKTVRDAGRRSTADAVSEETLVDERLQSLDDDATLEVPPVESPTDVGDTNSPSHTTMLDAPPVAGDDVDQTRPAGSTTVMAPAETISPDDPTPPAPTVIGDTQFVGQAGEPPSDDATMISFGGESLIESDDDDDSIPTANVSVAGYEILRELGRGGMGVVYQARQTALNRIVALKMLLAGAHASADHLARFRIEAEAVAQLQHPNIVQVFEVGEQDGLPFFSLEFVDGKGLDQEIDRKPQPARKAARLTESLARAMQYAHEHGILHRDLKPANVLLSSDGVAKITDFGLAKRLEDDTTNTRTGTVMGTPSYMSPEQARGRKDLGPATDIYALGAMLYEFLTGRPPFMGATAMEALMQVLESEPVPPSRLQPKVSKDLETICLKCLEKSPEKRYPSALALAEDLYRFQNGEPIQARPVGRTERVWRWCRRNPKIAIPSLLAVALAITVMIGGPVAAVVISREKALAVRERDRAEDNEKQARENEQRAVAARKEAQANERKAIAAQKQAGLNAERASRNAKQAAEQRSLALRALTTLVTEVQEKLEDTPATHQLKQSLLQTALKGLRQIAASAGQSTIADSRMAVAHQRMGNVFQVLGQVKDARAQYERMYAILNKLAAGDKNRARANRNLSIAASKLGDISLILGDKPSARKYYTEALTLRRDWAEKIAPKSLSAQIALATSYMKMGEISEPQRAAEHFGKARQLRAKFVKIVPKSQRPRRLRDLWIATIRLAETTSRLSRYSAARDLYSDALKIATALDSAATGLQSRQDLATTHELLGSACQRLQEPAKAREHFSKAVEIRRPLAEKDARNLPLQATFITALARLGRHVEAAKRADELRSKSLDNNRLLYVAACSYALCAEATANSASEKLHQQYADKAIDALLQAVKLGYRDAAYLKADHDLQSVRAHSRFSQVLEAITASNATRRTPKKD